MKQLIIYTARISIRDISVFEYLPFFLFPVFLSFFGYLAYSTLIVIFFAAKYCNQFNHLLNPFFIRITGIHNSLFLFISNIFILMYSCLFYCLAQLMIYLYKNEPFNLSHLMVFLILSICSILFGNIVSVIRRFIDNYKIINVLFIFLYILLTYVIWEFVKFGTKNFIIMVISVGAWILQLMIIKRYDYSKKYI